MFLLLLLSLLACFLIAVAAELHKEVLSVARAAEDPMPLAKRARETECKNDDSSDDNEDDSGDDDDDSGDDDN